jgi:hypothetical protein
VHFLPSTEDTRLLGTRAYGRVSRGRRSAPPAEITAGTELRVDRLAPGRSGNTSRPRFRVCRARLCPRRDPRNTARRCPAVMPPTTPYCSSAAYSRASARQVASTGQSAQTASARRSQAFTGAPSGITAYSGQPDTAWDPAAVAMNTRHPRTEFRLPSAGVPSCYLPSCVRLVLQLTEPAPYVDAEDHKDESHEYDQAETHHFLRLLRCSQALAVGARPAGCTQLPILSVE